MGVLSGNAQLAEQGTRDNTAERLVEGLKFDYFFIVLSAIFVGGLFLDGWAHNHGMVDDSFFTPWHAFFYGGFALIALSLIGAALLNHRSGAPWRAVLPAGYGLAALGAIIFSGGGVGDLVWHELFGIEEDFEALVSPTHLLLGIGMALIVTAPLRAAWRRPDSAGWHGLAPALLSATLLLSIFTFFMMFSHPLMSIIGGRAHSAFNQEVGQVAGVISLMLIAALLLGVLFVLL
ncbi:MAG: hypothetical protein R6W76_05370, partial [Caldilinea sp.]